MWPLILVPGLLGLAAATSLYFGYRSLKRKRLVENVPTSKVAGVFIGLTEVKGVSKVHQPLTSYLAEKPVVTYRFTVEEHWRKTETYTDSDGKTKTRTSSGWKTVRSGDIRQTFLLEDDTGAMRIDPNDAQIDCDRIFSQSCSPWSSLYYAKGPRYAIANSTHRRRFTEYAILPDQSLYILGTARLREDVLEPEIGYDKDEEMYLISTSSEEQVVKGYGRSAVGLLILGLVFAIAPPPAYHMLQGQEFVPALLAGMLVMVLLAFGYSILVFGAYLQLVYNGLIEVKNRIEAAWSLIDIQLKRRFDLIPNLVKTIKGFMQHERDVQLGITELRTQGTARVGMGLPDAAAAMLMAQVANEQTKALTTMFGYVERYPQLKADTHTHQLMEELARTERKVALARSFYNGSVTAFNNRLETMPDMLIAKPLGLKAASYFEIDDFEAAPVEITFEEKDSATAAEPDFADEAVPEGASELTAEQIEALKQQDPTDAPEDPGDA